MTRAALPEDVVDRWRGEVRRALPEASADLVEEVAQHLAQRWHETRAAGGSIAEADARAHRELAAWRRRPARRPWHPRTLWDGWASDVRRALRTSRRRPLFAAGMAALIAIAIGGCVAAFAVAYGLLWRPLPYPDGDRLAVLWQIHDGSQGQVSYPDYQDLTAGSLFDATTAISGGTGSLRVDDRIARVNMLDVEPAGLTLLGARPILGRLLGPGDRGTPNVLISHRLWRTRFGADPDIIGRSLWLSGQTFIVVGVLAPDFDFELPVGLNFRLEQQDLWDILDPAASGGSRRDFWSFEVLGRLRPGVTIEAAQRTIDAIGARLSREYPATNAATTFRVAWLSDEIVRAYRRPVLLSGLAALVAFLTALANVLMLASVRLADRQPELAVRQALGAGAFRIRRQLLTEHAVLVAIGAAGGVTLARLIVATMVTSTAAHLPRADAIRLDGPALMVAAILAAIILGALALLPLQRRGRTAALTAGARVAGDGRRPRRWFVAVELALALTLTTGGALLGLSLSRLLAVDPGFRPDGVITLRVSAYSAQHPGRDDVTTFFASVLDGVRNLPAVAAAGAGSSLPLSGQHTGTSVVAEGQTFRSAGAGLTAGWGIVSPGYFTALGMRVVAGRGFTAADLKRDSHVTVINETLARLLFHGTSAVGRRIAVGGDDSDWHEVVGVVADTHYNGLADPPEPRVYDLFGQHWGRTLFVVAHVNGAAPEALLAPIRRVVRGLDPEAPVFQAAAMTDLARQSAAPHRLAAGMALGLALTALLLALAGAYATTAVSVAERTREVGVRAALGAAPRDLVLLVLRDGLWTTAAGAVAGSLGAVAAARLVSAHLFGAQASDAIVVIPAVAIAVGAAAVAATIPAALRAAAVDPLIAMRAD
jgi:putative ABC transport system permease protein